MAATTVPTQDNILVPETLLKKRKSQERAREERAIATKEKRGTRHQVPWTHTRSRRSR
jgi:large subunit ribosomal protein L7e